MANRHIKVINGRKYYYESVRKGKKVTSRYLGPVEPVRRKVQRLEEGGLPPERAEEHAENPEESYIG